MWTNLVDSIQAYFETLKSQAADSEGTSLSILLIAFGPNEPLWPSTGQDLISFPFTVKMLTVIKAGRLIGSKYFVGISPDSLFC